MIEADADEFNSSKIIDFKTAARKISEFKKAGKTIGLCHGGFDLLHPGHIKHLESAAKMCDCLFVSVTSDRYVSSRKGEGRPIFSDKLRAYSVASLQCVNYVVISDFELGVEVIESLKPAYYIKGPDFVDKSTSGIITEKNMIECLGGEIKYTKDQKLSTTSVIKHIQENLKRKKLLIGIDRDGTLIEEVQFLGRQKNWKNLVKLRKEAVDLLEYAQIKYDTTMVVVSNQQGVARGYFDGKTVKSINELIGSMLSKQGIIIDNWQYCPEVDKSYASSAKGIKFRPEFVKEKTCRKPSPEMMLKALRDLKKSIEDFDEIVILGNSQDDAGMAKNINARFIDARNKDFKQLKNELENC